MSAFCLFGTPNVRKPSVDLGRVPTAASYQAVIGCRTGDMRRPSKPKACAIERRLDHPRPRCCAARGRITFEAISWPIFASFPASDLVDVHRLRRADDGGTCSILRLRLAAALAKHRTFESARAVSIPSVSTFHPTPRDDSDIIDELASPRRPKLRGHVRARHFGRSPRRRAPRRFVPD